MSDISKISVNEETYNIKDAVARQSVTELSGTLGGLAYKNDVSGFFTPSGSVSAPSVSVNPTTKNVATVSNVGTLPNWSANVSEEVLSFSFTTGTLPTTTTQTVVTGIADATASAPTFSGTRATITLS